ncbi:MAG: hypothetical protein A3F72_13740 [Bacteroidetes bacterium RIFCSPLOWO2_12_FULL_35_15]|nr:MAG: hypothetical protein A3F72_13740 [Bacteroidetes bacterium RIFCSPLOWO2_12_FULL_35_15]
MDYKELKIKEGFPLKKISLSEIAKLINAELLGENIDINFLVRLKTRKNNLLPHLTYITNEFYFNLFLDSAQEAAIISRDLLKLINSKIINKIFLIVDKAADTAFFELHEILSSNKYYSTLNSFLGANCDIHSSVVIYDNVVIKNNVKIHPNVVIYSNSIIDENVEIKPGTVIGGQGIERKELFGKPQLVSHTGGVYIGKNVFIGCNVSIDRGEMGDFTQIHQDAVIDNLVYVAHNVIIGPECFIIASSEISGSAIFGRGVWYSPKTCCKPEIVLGDYTYTGTGTVLVKDTKPFSLVYGNPGRQSGWMCKCQKYRLEFFGSQALCKCGRKFKIENQTVSLIEDI